MRPLLAFPILLAAGCSTPALEAPSLAPRAAEGIDPRLPVPTAPPDLSVDAALASRLAALVNQAQAGDRAFDAAVPGVRAAAAAAGAAGSESWVVAQQMLSALIALRAPVTRAAGDLDMLVAARIQGGGMTAGELQRIEDAAATIGAIDRSEAAVVSALQARLRG